MFTMQFETDNEAFSAYGATETARILRLVAKRIDAGDTDGRIVDLNGNAIGTFELNEE